MGKTLRERFGLGPDYYPMPTSSVDGCVAEMSDSELAAAPEAEIEEIDEDD